MPEPSHEIDARAKAYPVVDEFIRTFGAYTGAFVAEHPSAPGSFASFGSGFVVLYEGVAYIVTAAHVLNEFTRRGRCIFGLRESDRTPRQAFQVTRSDFVVDLENDIAVALLDVTLLDRTGVEQFPAMNMASVAPDDPDGVALHCLVGFQAVKNAYGHGIVVDEISGVSLWEDAPKPRESEIGDAVCFRFLPKHAYVTKGTRYPSRDVEFHGMSGGPLVKVVVPGTGLPANAEVAGVFAEWHSDKPCLVGASRRALLALLATTG